MNDSKLTWAAGGESLSAPEDTMPAYWGAIGAGADGLALGVQLTSDNVPVCCRNASLAKTTGDERKVSEVTAAELRPLDAGALFRSTELDAENQPSGTGDDTPWAGHGKKGDALYHPELGEVLLNFSTRTAILLHIITARGVSAARRQALVDAVLGQLTRFGLSRTALLAGDANVLRLVRKASPGTPLALVLRRQDDELKTLLRELSPSYLLIDAERIARRQKKGVELDAAFVKSLGKGKVRAIVTSGKMPFALPPDYFHALDAQDWVAGFVCRAVRETKDMRGPKHLMVAEDFKGQTIDRALWTMGYSKLNRDTEISHSDGLSIKIRSGGEYSGAAALTTSSICGDFDAQVSFTVASPAQGTTFELAAIQVDPGYHNTDNTKINHDNANLTFDVHGAPPYASSERDEDDGFRIGWNNGPALMRIVEKKGHVIESQSVNAYNKYSRDVGDGAQDNPAGRLRLVRRGEVFNAYYTDKHNRRWVLSGSASVPTLCRNIFLRLGAKHWPKGGRVPPPNQIDFHSFRLYQS
jgi:glycerophosphoryl diester phosphodiesterase